ncbi:hypothetical protein MSPP1_002345 [Malassezia sp. CBS 17886]|nr:hypothetical protein MSPP1_002345 [Malassezia sp. CBS 17886]
MLNTLFNPCEIQINFIQNVVFLRPSHLPHVDQENQRNKLPPLSNDELVRGIIHLFVPSARHIDGIRVQMRTTQSLAVLDAAFNYVPSTWESATIMKKTLEIGVPMRLSKMNPHREASASGTRARSPSHAYGGGGRSSDAVGVFKNMVRGVSRGRSSARALDRARSPLPRSRTHSPRPADEGAAGSACSSDFSTTPQERGSAHITDEDLQRVSHALEAHGSAAGAADADEGEDSVERRGRSKGKAPESGVVVCAGGQDGLELSKGVHAFEFAFILASDSPPYDRSPFGKTRYSVKVTALGAGRARGNVEAWKDFFPMVNPSPDGGVTPMSVLFNDLHHTVGMLSISCTSNSISVGGLFNIDIHSPCAPVDLIVYMVRVSLYTTIELHTQRKGRQLVPVQKRKLFEKGRIVPQDAVLAGAADTLPGYVRYAGTDHAWTVQGIARIPDDNAIRPSTMPGTRSALRFHHVLVVEVIHSRDSPLAKDCLTPDGHRKLKVFTLRQNVTIPSCCCALDAVTLPAYSASDTDTSVPALNQGSSSTWNQILRANKDSGESHNMCVCGMSLADLSAAERAMLPPADPTDLMIDRVVHNGKVGEISTPASPSATVFPRYAPAAHGGPDPAVQHGAHLSSRNSSADPCAISRTDASKSVVEEPGMSGLAAPVYDPRASVAGTPALDTDGSSASTSRSGGLMGRPHSRRASARPSPMEEPPAYSW